MALNLKLEACGLEVTVLGPCGKPLPIFSKREDASSGNRVNHLVAPSGGGEFAVEVKRGDEAKCYSRAIIATLKIDGRWAGVGRRDVHLPGGRTRRGTTSQGGTGGQLRLLLRWSGPTPPLL